MTVNPIETLLEDTHSVRRQEEKYRGGEGRVGEGRGGDGRGSNAIVITLLRNRIALQSFDGVDDLYQVLSMKWRTKESLTRISSRLS